MISSALQKVVLTSLQAWTLSFLLDPCPSGNLSKICDTLERKSIRHNIGKETIMEEANCHAGPVQRTKHFIKKN